MEQVVISGWTVQGAGTLRYVVNGEGHSIVICKVRVESAIVLSFRKTRAARCCVVRNVGNAIETISDTWIRNTLPRRIMRAQWRGQRRTEIQSLTRNRHAICAFQKAGISASRGVDGGAVYTGTREGQILSSDASGRG